MKKFIRMINLILIITFLIQGNISFAAKNEDWAKNMLSTIKFNPNKNVYQVIVFGGDPEGVAAALSAARAGAKVLLLSYEDGLGGLMTYGWLNSIDMNYSTDRKMVTQGIFKEFYTMIGGDSFDVEVAKIAFEKMVENEKNITYIRNAKLENVIMQENIIKGIKITVKNQTVSVYADRIIDATQDGDITTMAGAPYTYGGQDIGLNEAMCITLVFKVSGVNWENLKQEIIARKSQGITNEGINKVSAWGFGDISKNYKPINKNMRLRGLNIGKQNDGTVLINALQIIEVNGLNQQEKEISMTKGKIEAKNAVEFLRKNVAGFEQAQFIEVAPEFYIRETRHIKGEYTLKATDILENTDFWDKIAIGSYPMDIQTTLTTNYGFVVGNPDQYSIPLRCIIPQNVDNLFIVGKTASYSSLAASSSRVIPVGMCTGEAAGVASVYSIIYNITPRNLSKDTKMVYQIQELLKKQGAYLGTSKIKPEITKSWAYEDIKKLTSLRLVLHGYARNGIDLTKNLTEQSFLNLSYGYLNRINPTKYNEQNYPMVIQYKNTTTITSDRVAKLAYYFIKGQEVKDQEAYQLAKQNGVLTDNFINKTKQGEKITLDEAYNIAVRIIEKVTQNEIK